MQRILDVLHDKRTMDKVLQVIELINEDLYNVLKYGLKQVWRAKEILDAEGVSDPGNLIPMYKMARLITLFLTGDVNEVNKILPIVGKVVNGEGLDVVKVKELMRDHLDFYENWAPELDRAIRWAELMVGPSTVSPFFVEENVTPLAEIPLHIGKLQAIPSAGEIYDRILDKPQLPLESSFSNLVSRVAPYLSFRQIEFLLQSRAASDWQQEDLRRLRYVYSIKRKVLEIAESYGGLSFLPQSFLVSVFLGEATRNSHRAPYRKSSGRLRSATSRTISSSKASAFSGSFRFKASNIRFGDRLNATFPSAETSTLTRITPGDPNIPSKVFVDGEESVDEIEEYEIGDSLLGPQDVAILLQSGLTSVMKTSTVVQLNQRMLLDLICSQPRSFAIAVLAEIGTPGGQGSPRSLTSALMALLEIDQTAFKLEHQVDMHALLEAWLPGVRIPRREDYMAGGRWARQSYYEAIFAVAKSVLDDAETYNALKVHIQRSRISKESDPIPVPKEETKEDAFDDDRATHRLRESVDRAKHSIKEADILASPVVNALLKGEHDIKNSEEYSTVARAYQEAFDACAHVVSLDKYAFHTQWFGDFYKRNYDALMIKSMFDNIIDDIDKVRHWLHCLRNGALSKEAGPLKPSPPPKNQLTLTSSGEWEPLDETNMEIDTFFLEPEAHTDQEIVDAIIDATIYNETDRERLRTDPLVRMLLPNPPGKYNFTIVSAMGVITEGERGLELKDAFKRLEEKRGIQVIRADTGTARSLDYNSGKIQDAMNEASKLQRPFGLLGYSQGCANILMAETEMLSGTPSQRETISSPKAGLVCRQLLFSAANGSAHGPGVERKIQRLIVMCEEFFKYQQGYVSRALASTVLEALNDVLDSAAFHKAMGGAQIFLEDGCRAFWRESQQMV